MSILLFCLLFGASEGNVAYKNRVEIIEVNYCYDRRTGLRRFVQVIYWGKDPPGSHVMHVVAWHMQDCADPTPCYDPAKQRYVVIWQRKNGKCYYVEARFYKITHTCSDPEVSDRRLLPVDCRRGLVTLVGYRGF